MAKLQHFKCKGSIGLYYGLGVDEVAVNFENISGLINLAGNNGHGKTTFLEMLSPFATFPSRKMKSPQKYNYKKQFRLRDSFKEVSYLHKGKQYVFRIELPAGTTMAPEGYISCDGEPLVKGKISDYKKMVTELFGSEKLFYSSIFSCQGGQKLTDLTVGDFKQLLIELLGLNKYTEYWHNAKAVISMLEKKLEKTLYDLNIFQEKQIKINENKNLWNEQIVLLETKKSSERLKQSEIKRVTEEITELTKTLSESEKQELLNSEKKKQLERLTADIVSLRNKIVNSDRDLEEWIEDHDKTNDGYAQLVLIKDSILDAAKNLSNMTDKKLSLDKKLEETVDEGTVKKEEIAALDLKLSELNASMIKIENDSKASKLKILISDEKQNHTNILNEIETLTNSISLLTKDLPTKDLEKELSQFSDSEYLLGQRPEKCSIDDCPFIKNSLEKIALKPGKQKEIENSRALNQEKIEEENKKLEQKNILLEDVREKILHSEFDLSTLNEKNDKKIAELSEKIITIQSKKNLLEKEKESLSEEYSGIKSEIDLVIKEIDNNKSLSEKKDQLKTAEEILKLSVNTKKEKISSHEAEKTATEKTMAGLEVDAEKILKNITSSTPEKTPELIKIDLKLSNSIVLELETEVSIILVGITETEKKIAVFEDRSKMSKEDSKKITDLNLNETKIRTLISKWSYIRDAVSKSGLQALEISAAAPLLTSIANDLLHSAFGGEFYLDLVTLDPDTGAEILDIMITREDGESYPLSDFSGGESVWVLQAFKAAQIIVNSEKSGIHFETCFADEESGALDKEKAEKFILMYRALMDRGNFEKLFFISHIPECQAMADHSLVFKKGGIDV